MGSALDRLALEAGLSPAGPSALDALAAQHAAELAAVGLGTVAPGAGPAVPLPPTIGAPEPQGPAPGVPAMQSEATRVAPTPGADQPPAWLRVPAAILMAPIESAATLRKPPIGSRISPERGEYGNVPEMGSQAVVTPETPGAIPERAFDLAALQTAGNLVAGPVEGALAEKAGALAAERFGPEAAESVLGKALTHAAAAAPVGAGVNLAYDPEHPVSAILTGGALASLAAGVGGAVHAKGELATQAAQQADRDVAHQTARARLFGPGGYREQLEASRGGFRPLRALAGAEREVPPAFPAESEQPPAASGTAVDADGVRRFAKARTMAGTRRPVGRVSTEGLLAELGDMMTKRDDAIRRAQYHRTFDDDRQETITVATRQGSGPTTQAKALTNLEDFDGITSEIERELKARGLSDAAISEAMVARHDASEERSALQGDFDPRRANAQVVTDADGHVLFEPHGPYDAGAVGERRGRTYRAPEQGDLFHAEPEAQAESARVTHGSPEQANATAERVAEEGGRFVRATVDGRPTSPERLHNLRTAKAKRAWVDIRGQRVRGPDDVRQLVTPFRDPYAERMGTILTDDEGRVLSHHLVTSGALNYVAFDARWEQRLLERAKKLGATRVVFWHNHPSGVAIASPEDKLFTSYIAQKLGKGGLAVDGQYVIDHTEGTWIDAIGEASPHAIPPEAAAAMAPDWTSAHGATSIRGPNDVAALALGAQNPRALLVAYVDSQHRVVALEPHSAEAVQTLFTWLPQRLKAHAARVAFLITDRSVAPDTYDRVLKTVNWARSLAPSGPLRNVLDIVDVSRPGGEGPGTRSAYESGRLLPAREPRGTRTNRTLFEPAEPGGVEHQPQEGAGEDAEERAPTDLGRGELAGRAAGRHTARAGRVRDLLAQRRVSRLLREAPPGSSLTPANNIELPTSAPSGVGEASAPSYGESPEQSPGRPRFYSRLERAIEGAPFEKGTGEQWRAAVSKNVSKSEREYTGLDTFLAEHARDVLTRAQVQDYFAQHKIELGETVLGGDSGEEPRYDAYTEPGGHNYREILLTLPDRSVSQETGRYRVRLPSADFPDEEKHATEAQIDDMRRRGDDVEVLGPVLRRDDRDNYLSPHFEQPNILAHVRVDDRTLPNGERVLFVEEIQSDWHQAGREHGYQGDATALSPDESRRLVTLTSEMRERRLTPEEDAERRALLHRSVRADHAVPNAPFKKADEWAGLALRRLIDEAAAGGYDRLAWTTGETQNARYDLSRRVSKLVYWPSRNELLAFGPHMDPIHRGTYAPGALPEVIGKEAAQRLLESAPHPSGMLSITGDDLKVAGPGMTAFYDRIVPQTLQKYAKSMGVKLDIEPADLPLPEQYARRKRYVGTPLTDEHLNEVIRRLESGRARRRVGGVVSAIEAARSVRILEQARAGGGTAGARGDVLAKALKHETPYTRDNLLHALGGDLEPVMQAVPPMRAHSAKLPSALTEKVRREGQPLGFSTPRTVAKVAASGAGAAAGGAIGGQVGATPEERRRNAALGAALGGAAGFGLEAAGEHLLGVTPELATEHGLTPVHEIGAAEPETRRGRAAPEAEAPRAGELIDSAQRLLVPPARTAQAATASHVIRANAAQLARDLERESRSLRALGKVLDKASKAERLAFIDRMEHGEAQPTPELERVARALRTALDQARDEVRGLGTGKLEAVIDNYFPHLWEDPSAFGQFMRRIAGKRPLEGSKSFLKKRSIPTTADGIAAGLTPVTTHPVDLTLLKLREMRRYVMAHRILDEMKGKGLAHFVPAFERAPEGYRPIDDGIATVYGPPTVQMSEHYDEQVREKLETIIAQLGVKHERRAQIGGSRLGYAQGATRIVTKAATPLDTLMHELGHVLDERYGLWKHLTDVAGTDRGAVEMRKRLHGELRALADLRFEGHEPTPGYQRYVRNRKEKMAVALQALLYAPERMQEVAPTIKRALTAFLGARPELKPLLDVKPSLVHAGEAHEIPVGGMVIKGKYYAPEPVARVMNNYLSPGLAGNALYDAYRAVGNGLNGVQLGMSAFHLGMTSLDAAVSKTALALQEIARGRPLRAGRNLLEVPVAPVTNYLRGSRVLREYLRPGTQGGDMARLVDALVQGGGRVAQDEFYRNSAVKKFLDALHDRRPVKAAALTLPATMEAIMRPIFEHIVPRQKLGVFADLARHELAQLPADASAEDVRRVMGRAWDSVDNRMGQLVYDNLFWHKATKDVALAGVRSVGWNWGTFRELGGGAYDAAVMAKRAAQAAAGRAHAPLELTPRMAYLAALPMTVGLAGGIYTYLATGERPQGWKDYFYPRTGRKDADGNDERVELPSYMKDLVSYARHPVQTVSHKLHPLLGMVADMLQNEDYYGDKIRNPDDPVVRQLVQEARYVGEQVVPFGIQNLREVKTRTGSVTGGLPSFVGVTPAPREEVRTKAQNRVMQLLANRRTVGATPEQSAAREQRTAIRSGLRTHDAGALDALEQGLASGAITRTEAKRLRHDARVDPWVARFKQLTVDEALEVYQQATPAERRLWRRALFQKVQRARRDGRRELHMPPL